MGNIGTHKRKCEINKIFPVVLKRRCEVRWRIELLWRDRQRRKKGNTYEGKKNRMVYFKYM